jgi:hypothetical protein
MGQDYLLSTYAVPWTHREWLKCCLVIVDKPFVTVVQPAFRDELVWQRKVRFVMIRCELRHSYNCLRVPSAR